MGSGPEGDDYAVLRTMRRPTLVQVVVVVIVAVIGAALAGAIVGTRTATYESRTAVLIDQPRAIAAAGDEGVIAKLVRLRTKYAGLVPTPRLLQPVADAVHRPLGEVAGSVRVEVPVNSLLLTVVATSSDRHLVGPLSHALGERLRTYAADEQQQADIPADQRFTFAVVAGPSTPTKVSPSRDRALAVAATVGLLLLLVPLAALALRPNRS
jgi:capsular polysaccharide biosynthesis protein